MAGTESHPNVHRRADQLLHLDHELWPRIRAGYWEQCGLIVGPMFLSLSFVDLVPFKDQSWLNI